MMPNCSVVNNHPQKLEGFFQQPLAWMAAILCLVVEGVVTAAQTCSSSRPHFFTHIAFLPTYLNKSSRPHTYRSLSFSLLSPPPERMG